MVSDWNEPLKDGEIIKLAIVSPVYDSKEGYQYPPTGDSIKRRTICYRNNHTDTGSMQLSMIRGLPKDIDEYCKDPRVGKILTAVEAESWAQSVTPRKVFITDYKVIEILDKYKTEIQMLSFLTTEEKKILNPEDPTSGLNVKKPFALTDHLDINVIAES